MALQLPPSHFGAGSWLGWAGQGLVWLGSHWLGHSSELGSCLAGEAWVQA